MNCLSLPRSSLRGAVHAGRVVKDAPKQVAAAPDGANPKTDLANVQKPIGRTSHAARNDAGIQQIMKSRMASRKAARHSAFREVDVDLSASIHLRIPANDGGRMEDLISMRPGEPGAVRPWTSLVIEMRRVRGLTAPSSPEDVFLQLAWRTALSAGNRSRAWS